MFRYILDDFLPKEEYTPPVLQREKATVTKTENSNFDDIEQLMELHVRKPSAANDEISVRMTVTELLEHLGLANLKKADLNHAASVLKSMGVLPRRSNGKTFRCVALKRGENR